MVTVTSFIVLSLLFSTCASASLEIVNGHRAKIKDFPYTVSIIQYLPGYFEDFLCGGAILDETTIVTAGRCVLYYELDTIKVGVGHSYIFETTMVDVAKVIQHEEYVFTPPYKHDIAIIKLVNPLPLGPKVQPVKLPQANSSTPEGKKGNVTGWGTEQWGKTAYQLMQKLDVKVYTDDDCERAWANVTDQINPEISFATDRDVHICAKYPEAVQAGVCLGDHGDPLVIDGVLYGLVSYYKTDPCGLVDYPFVLTKISALVNWITPKLG